MWLHTSRGNLCICVIFCLKTCFLRPAMYVFSREIVFRTWHFLPSACLFFRVVLDSCLTCLSRSHWSIPDCSCRITKFWRYQQDLSAIPLLPAFESFSRLPATPESIIYAPFAILTTYLGCWPLGSLKFLALSQVVDRLDCSRVQRSRAPELGGKHLQYRFNYYARRC